MTSVILHTSVTTVTNVNTLDPSSWLGGATAWDDASDSTYTRVYTSFDSSVSSSAFQDLATANLGVLPAPPAGATINSITLNFRAAVAAQTPNSLRVYARLEAGTNLDYVDFRDAGGFWVNLPGGFTPTSYTHPIGPDDSYSNLAVIALQLQASGNRLTFGAFNQGTSPYHYGVTVYEASLVVDYTGTTPTPTVTPPLRLYPRNDGLGASSAPRLYPPPNSRQGSNRVTGYL